MVWLGASSSVTCGAAEPAQKKPLAQRPPAGPRPGPALGSKLTFPTLTLSRLNPSFVLICARADVRHTGFEKPRDTKEPHPPRARPETSAERHLAEDFEAPACAFTWPVGLLSSHGAGENALACSGPPVGI